MVLRRAVSICAASRNPGDLARQYGGRPVVSGWGRWLGRRRIWGRMGSELENYRRRSPLSLPAREVLENRGDYVLQSKYRKLGLEQKT